MNQRSGNDGKSSGRTYLASYETIRLRDEEGDGELGNDKENERELERLHDSLCRREGKSEGFWSGENDGVGSKLASLSKEL